MKVDSGPAMKATGTRDKIIIIKLKRLPASNEVEKKDKWVKRNVHFTEKKKKKKTEKKNKKKNNVWNGDELYDEYDIHIKCIYWEMRIREHKSSQP